MTDFFFFFTTAELVRKGGIEKTAPSYDTKSSYFRSTYPPTVFTNALYQLYKNLKNIPHATGIRYQ